VSLVTLYILRHSHTHGSATPHHTISLLVIPLVAAFCFRLSVTSCLSISVCGPTLTLGVTLSHSVTSSHLCHSATPSHTIILSHHDTPAPHCIALTPVSLRRPGSSRNTCVTPSLPVSLRHRHSPSLHDPRHSDRQTHWGNIYRAGIASSPSSRAGSIRPVVSLQHRYATDERMEGQTVNTSHTYRKIRRRVKAVSVVRVRCVY